MAIAGAEPAKPDASIHLFHPIYHTYSVPMRSRIDVDRTWPARLDELDSEELIDTFSEPPQFVERVAPVSVQFGEQIIRAHNWTELRVKILRQTLDLFGLIGRFIESTLKRGGAGSRIPFTSVSLDPDIIHRVIELDYETGESTYQQLVGLFGDGAISPGITPPFQNLLPTLSDSEIRTIARITFTFYQRIIKKYHAFLKRNGEEGLMVLSFWLPETAYQTRVIDILREEFDEFSRKERLGKSHLVFLLDSDQANFKETDVLMKSWNVLNPNGASKKPRPAAHGHHPATDSCSVVFRDRVFSDWVAYANPSVKKLLDRTIAKVDSDLNAQGVHYGWAHFEDLDAMAFSPKSVVNFKQKLVKLAELGYVPLSPDFYIRGKLRGQLGYAKSEPLAVDMREESAGIDWSEDRRGFVRWNGQRLSNNSGEPVVAEARKFQRNTPEGLIEDEAPQCWKLAWMLTRDHCLKEAIGDPEEMDGGMYGVLADLVGGNNARRKKQNVMDFLVQYTHIYWREHFIQHDLSEADINIHEIANETLRQGLKANLTEREAAVAGAAAQAIYFAFDSGRATGTKYEHMDHRAFYQNVAMLTLAMSNAVYAYQWMGETKKARKLVDMIKTELIGFETAYQRYTLSKYNVKKKCWEKALEPHIDDSKHNIVRRAAVRVAATQLRPLGYTRDFSREDELATTNVGHIWSLESNNLNWKFENPYYCGVKEK